MDASNLIINILTLFVTILIAVISGEWTIFIFKKRKEEKFFNNFETLVKLIFTPENMEKLYSKSVKSPNNEIFNMISSFIDLIENNCETMNSYIKKFINSKRKFYQRNENIFQENKQIKKDIDKIINKKYESIENLISPLTNLLLFSLLDDYKDDIKENIEKSFRIFQERLIGLVIEFNPGQFFSTFYFVLEEIQ